MEGRPMASILDRLMRAGEGKILRDLSKVVDKVNSFEGSITPLSDDQLRAKTQEFKSRLSNGETLDALIWETDEVIYLVKIKQPAIKQVNNDDVEEDDFEDELDKNDLNDQDIDDAIVEENEEEEEYDKPTDDSEEDE